MGILRMRTLAKVVLAIVVFAIVCGFLGFRWWQQPGPGTTSIQLSGKSGDSFTGFYVEDGRRVEVRGVLPWKIESDDISEAELRKPRADAPLKLEARHFKKHGFDAFVGGTVKP